MNHTFKASALSLAFGLLLSTGAFAQSTPANHEAKPAVTKTSSDKHQVATHREETKDEWLKHYNDLKPKLDAIANNAKMESKNAEFSAEAQKLNDMATAFKAKLDGWDAAHAGADKESYMKNLREAHNKLNAQYTKVKGMWDKMHPNAGEKKGATKSTPEKQ